MNTAEARAELLSEVACAVGIAELHYEDYTRSRFDCSAADDAAAAYIAARAALVPSTPLREALAIIEELAGEFEVAGKEHYERLQALSRRDETPGREVLWGCPEAWVLTKTYFEGMSALFTAYRRLDFAHRLAARLRQLAAE